MPGLTAGRTNPDYPRILSGRRSSRTRLELVPSSSRTHLELVSNPRPEPHKFFYSIPVVNGASEKILEHGRCGAASSASSGGAVRLRRLRRAVRCGAARLRRLRRAVRCGAASSASSEFFFRKKLSSGIFVRKKIGRAVLLVVFRNHI